MKQVEVTFKTRKGVPVIRRVNSSSSTKAAVESLAKSLPDSWVVDSYKIVKEW